MSYFSIISTSKIFIRDLTRKSQSPPVGFNLEKYTCTNIMQPSTRTRCSCSLGPLNLTRWAGDSWWTDG
jgi:hypothetical protein